MKKAEMTKRAIRRAREGDYYEYLPGEDIVEGINYDLARADVEIKRGNYNFAIVNLRNAYEHSEQLLGGDTQIQTTPKRKKVVARIIKKLEEIMRKSPDKGQQRYIARYALQIRKENGIEARSQGLENAVKGLIVIGILGGLFFLFPNVTGNTIGNISCFSSNILGVIFLVLGLVGSYFLIRKK